MIVTMTTMTIITSIIFLLPFQLISSQWNIIRPFNIQVLPVLPLLLLLLADDIGCLGELVTANFLAFGGGESGDAAEERG